MMTRMQEFKAWKLLSLVHRKRSIPWHEALQYLSATDKMLWELINIIHENNHKFYNPTNTKWLIVTADMHLMVTSDPKTKKKVLKGLKKEIRELKRTIRKEK